MSNFNRDISIFAHTKADATPATYPSHKSEMMGSGEYSRSSCPWL